MGPLHSTKQQRQQHQATQQHQQHIAAQLQGRLTLCPALPPRQVAELAAVAAEHQADIDAAPSGKRSGGSGDSGSEAAGGEDGEGDPLLQRTEAAELAAAAAGRRAAAAEAEVDKLKVGGILPFSL